MLKNVLFPEKIRGYYLFAQRVAGVAINKSHISVTVVYLRGTNITIEQCLTVPIEPDTNKEQQERVAEAIRKALAMIGKEVAVHTVIGSEHVIFKSMKLPFTDPEKIKKVLDFEVEPLLPFSIHEAVVDFIITRTIEEDQSAEIMVAAVQKIYIEQLLDLFARTGVAPVVIGIDIFSLYGLYKFIPPYAEYTESVALLDIGSATSKLPYIINGQLRFIRTIPTGTHHIAKELSHALNITLRDAMQELMRFGFEKIDSADYTHALNQACSALKKQVQFSLASFATSNADAPALKNILLLGDGADIKGLHQWIEKEFGVPTSLFNPSGIIQHEQVHLKKMLTIPQGNSMSTAIALPTPITEHINLRQKEYMQSDSSLLLRQLMLGSGFTLVLFVSLLLYSYMQIRTLKNEIADSQQEITEALTERFPTISADEDIESQVESAQETITQEEKLWFSFSPSMRNAFLLYLLELTNLDREGLGLIVEKITLDQDRDLMTLKAQVKDTDALKKLENELRRSGMFIVQPQEQPNFTMELRFKGTKKGEK